MARYIDLSENNPSVDFAQVKKDGFTGDFLKATEGSTFHDPTFHQRFAESKKAGLQTGAYCFARPATSTALEEVHSFVETVNAAGGFEVWPEFPDHFAGACDAEDAGGLNGERLRAYLIEWLTEFEVLTGKKGWLYTGLDFYKEYDLASVIDKTGAELWIAAYGQSTPNVKEAMWQETDNGHIKGVVGNVDIDVTENVTEPPKVEVHPSQREYYTVVSNDSMWEIAVKHHVSLQELEKLNPEIPDFNVIHIGEKVRVK